MSIVMERYVQSASDLPPQQPGATVPATRRVAAGTPVIQTPGGATAGVPVRDLPHEDAGLAILWRAELRGALHTLQEAPAQIDPSSGNAWLLDGGSTTLLAPPPVPASQRLPGVAIRPRSAVVWIIARRPYTISGPILWNTRYVPETREILVPGDPPTPEVLEYAQPESGPPKAIPAGQWDTIRLTWFEPLERWSAEVIVGDILEQSDLGPPKQPEKQPDDDDKGKPDPGGDDGGFTGDGAPYNPDDIARPPGAGAPDDAFIDDDGNRRLRSQGRLFLLTSTNLYLLSGDGGRTWERFTGPWGAGAAASVQGGVVHVVDGAGGLWVSAPGALTWSRAPRGVQLAQTAAGGGNQLAIGRAGRIVIDGGAAREGDTPLGDRSLTSLAYRRPSGSGADAWEIADERRGSLDGARRGIIVNRVEDTSTGTQYWVGPRAASPTIAAGPYRILFDRTTWLDATGTVWRPLPPFAFLTDEIAWQGGSALDYAQAIADALNPRARERLTGPYLPLPVDVSASVEWVEYPDNTRRARLTLLWNPRTPAAGEFPNQFRPHDRLRLDGAFGLEAVSGLNTDADWDATTSTVRYEGNIDAATPEAAPNSDSFSLLKIDSYGGDLRFMAAVFGNGGLVNGTIRVTAIHNTTFGWNAAGPLPPGQDMTRSILQVEIIMGGYTWRGGVGGEGLPEDQRPIRDERINGTVVVELLPDPNALPPQQEIREITLSVTFPPGWRVPIDFQQIGTARPWRGMTSEGLASSLGVAFTYRSPSNGAWLIAADDRQTTLATVSGQTLEFSPSPAVPPTTRGPVVATRDAFAVVGLDASGALAVWSGPPESVFNNEAQIGPHSGPLPIYAGGGSVLLMIFADGRVEVRPGFSASPTVLAGRGGRLAGLNRRAGRWWVVERGTNKLYWSNDGQTWRVLPALGSDVQAVEIEGE